VRDNYSPENYKSLMKEIAENTDKQRDVMRSRIGRISIIKCPYFSKQSTDSM
jgi:hypothetical protein